MKLAVFLMASRCGNPLVSKNNNLQYKMRFTVKQTIKTAVLRQDYLTSSSPFALMDPFFTAMADGGAS